MLEVLQLCWVFMVELGSLGWGVLMLLTGWVLDLLTHLHNEAPRLEGLLVGVTLAWVMNRRNKHPILRVVSAPLKLVVDILDLAWDQVVEVAKDLWGTARGWVIGSLGWVKGKVVNVYRWTMNMLKSVKDKLLTKKKE